MPSVSSSSRPKVLDSSTVMTPSLPTLSMASLIISPIAVSPAEMDAVEAICSLVSTSLASLDSSSLTRSTATSMPRLSAIGLAPAATLRSPSRTSAWASTVAVVVPSPATSSVFFATSLTSSAPIFSHGSSSSISLAMDTPSLVIVGAPHFFSSTTFRPLGPRVTFTASASWFMPRSRPRLASSSNAIIFAAIGSSPPWRTCGPADARDGRHAGRQALPATGQCLIARSRRLAVTLVCGVPRPCLALSVGECKRQGRVQGVRRLSRIRWRHPQALAAREPGCLRTVPSLTVSQALAAREPGIAGAVRLLAGAAARAASALRRSLDTGRTPGTSLACWRSAGWSLTDPARRPRRRQGAAGAPASARRPRGAATGQPRQGADRLMRILVTGGAGFIGSHYVRTLLTGGYPGYEDARVTVLDKLTYAGNLANLEPVAGGFAFVRGDICDAGLLAQVVPGHDAVLN